MTLNAVYTLFSCIGYRESSGYNERSCFGTNGQMYGHEG